MFKDYNKFLNKSLKLYLFVLIIIFIMKLVGLSYFGLDINNTTVNDINNFLLKYKLTFVFYFINLCLYQYLMTSIMCNDNSKKFKIYTLCTLPFTALLQYYKYLNINNPAIYILEFLYLFVICKIYNKNVKSKKIIITLIIVFALQVISNFAKNKETIIYENDFVRNTILNIDYFLMLLIYYKISLEGGILCQVQVGLSSLKKIKLKKFLKNLQKEFQKYLNNFKEKSKEEKLSIVFYIILSLIWNTISVLIILIVATLNHTFIECIFILTSFWLSKRAFGKAFHLSSMSKCFIISNLTYYILNRITTPLGISIIIPIILGVGLSYFTSKLVKKTYKPLYRGMSKDLFEETILNVTDKNSIKYKICYDFYINNKSDLYLSFKYNYSVAGIRKIKTRLNDKIKELK